MKYEIESSKGKITIDYKQTSPDEQTINVHIFKETGKWYTDLYINLPVKQNELSYQDEIAIRDTLENRQKFKDFKLVVMADIPYML